MDKKALSTEYTFEFYDGTTTTMTLAFIKLKMLASKNKKLYDRYMQVMTTGGKDEFDTLTVLYAAYVCAHLGEENILTEDEFIEKCGTDRFALNDAVTMMTNPKKRKASENLSN